jgi:fatty-acyl-CoA synthase
VSRSRDPRACHSQRGRSCSSVHNDKEIAMEGLIQDFPLTLHHVLWRAGHLFARKEIVTRRGDWLHRYTNADLIPRVRQLAAALRRLGVKPGDRVATLAWNNYRHVELYYAVPCMGAVLHALNLRLSPEQLAYIANDAGDSVIVVDEDLLPSLERFIGQVPGVRHVIVMSDDGTVRDGLLDYETLLAAEEPEFAWPEVDERAPAAMCYTSGTTGNPKGVVYTHRSMYLHALAVMLEGTLRIDEPDAILPLVPMFHANAWGMPYVAGLSGAKLICPDRWMGDAESTIDLALREEATFLAGVPTIWVNVLQKLGERRLPKVRMVMCGGSAISRALMESMDAAGLRMAHAWGMTETGPMATVCHPRTWHKDDEIDVRVMQGPPVPGVELRICDLETGAELPWDGVAFGEIQARGPWICAGYHNGADPTRMTDDGWFKTGDVATVSEDGFITVVDRAKDVIKSGGEWVSSVELENAIMAHPKVLEAAVIGVPHPKWQERPVGYVVARAEFRGRISEAEILDHLSTRFMRWWLPDEIRFIDEVPKTSVGKFDKKVLRARAAPLTNS